MTVHSTLFERLGGAPAVKSVIEDFYTRNLADPKLAIMFEDVSMTKLKYHQLAFMKVAFSVIPDDLDVAKMIFERHVRLFKNKGLNETHFDLVAQNFVAALQHHDVSPELIDEAVGVIAPLRPVFEEGATKAKRDDAESPVSIVQDQTQQSGKPTLMDRLGGNAAVKAAVEGLYTKLLEDPELSPFFEDINMAHLKQHQIQFMKIAFTQIPDDMDVVKYMQRAHARMIEEKGLNEKHFDLVAGHFVDVLMSLGVAQELIDEAVGVIGPLRGVFEQQA